MAIINIHILNEPIQSNNQALQAQAALEAKRMAEHRRGLHPWGSMRRDCPLCQADK